MTKHRIDEIYRDQITTVFAVFSVHVDVFRAVSAYACYANIEPVWIIVSQGDELMAMDMQAKRISVNQLSKLVPELKKFL
ncbi:hypothetical protein [Marinicella sp. W31]|uniref:hypothetical protein n=1 Tax=Marinicella sp. W31 TaxID=3023713 RepID=UPI0037570EC6